MSEIALTYYFWVALVLAGASIAWMFNFIALPGNWGIVGLAGLLVWAGPAGPVDPGLTWETVGLMLVIAAGGEVLEFVAGAAGAARQGASRRAIALALIGTVAGSIAGAVAGLPIPIAGSLVGALAGGAGGAFAGAYLGEMWKHGISDQGMSVGWGAAIGRLLGTLGKLAIGIILIVILAVRAL
ncbi:MAG: DUF456 family protein [Hyphomicrobiales bacterium]|nr:DUF456 family protein [Hyphomicrobiales bacterium]